MTRCPKCDSPEVYRHTGFRRRRRYICRECMADLARKPHAFISLQTVVFLSWLVGEGVALSFKRLSPFVVIAAGSAVLVVLMWIADKFQTELEVVKRLSDPVTDGSPRFARRAWFGLRRRTSEPVEHN